jgi:hypothetical protein
LVAAVVVTGLVAVVVTLGLVAGGRAVPDVAAAAEGVVAGAPVSALALGLGLVLG